MSSTTASSTVTASSTGTAAAASCTTAVPGKYGYVPEDACNAQYNFNPQFAPAVAVTVIFGVLTVAHIVLAAIYKKRYAWVLIMGGIWETVAFILHSLGAHDQQNGGYSIGWTLLFLLAPLWINGFVYMTFARTVYYFKPDHKVWIVKAVGMSKYFVWADIATFLIQATGGSMATPGSGSAQTGLNIYIAGLGCQELVIIIFLGLMIVFHRDCLALERAEAAGVQPYGQFMQPGRRNWRGLLYTLYAVLLFISLRIFYRMAEFGGGLATSNPLPFHEIYGYVLDALPMSICLLILAVMYPGRTLHGPDSELPRKTRKEKKAEKRAKKEQKAQRKAEKKQLKTGNGHVELQDITQDKSIHDSSRFSGMKERNFV